MKIQTSVALFRDSLSLAASLLKREGTPQQTSVLLRAHNDRLEVIGQDGIVYAKLQRECVVNEPGDVAVPAKNLLSVLKVLAPGSMTFTADNEGKGMVVCGKSQYKLSTFSSADYPPDITDEFVEVAILPVAKFKSLIDGISHAIAPDDNRYGLNGALIETHTQDGTEFVRMVGTDGNRLSFADIEGSMREGFKKGSLIPRSSLQYLSNGLTGETVTISAGERWAEFTSGPSSFRVRFLVAEFPNYREVLPRSYKGSFSVNINVLKDAIRRCMVFSDNSHTIRFKVEPTMLTLTSRKLDAGDSREELDIVTDSNGTTSALFGANGKFILDALSATWADEIIFNFGDPLAPFLIEGKDCGDTHHIVMPLRLE